MAGVAVIILRVVAEIRDVAEGIKESDRQASRLCERVAAVEPAVFAIKSGRRVVSSSESLRQLSAAVEDIRNFLSAYAGTSKLNRAMNRKPNAAKFTRLGALLTERMQALQLNVSVEEWAKEDASDRLEDLENFIDMLDLMERQNNRNHAEVMGVLKTLRKDERSELAESFEINAEKDLDFENSTRLGEGGFGEVRTAKWNGVDVAVKQLLRGRLDRDDIRALRKEVRIHSDLRFPHVVQLYAACTIAPNLCLVIELASGGSLRQYLHSAKEPLSHPLQAAFLYDIARGTSFLHSRGILHRDLKSANVLMFDNGRLKLCDFGLSKVKTESSKSGRGAAGTVPWMAPEVLGASPANERTDVYSFGVVSFEVAAQAEPFKGMNAAQVIMAVVVNKKRPQIPKGASASPDVVSLMEKCWKQDPADRPEGFGPVVRALGSVVSRVGDPRMLNAAAAYFTPSSGATRGGVPSANLPTAPLTVSGGVGASPLESMLRKEPLATAARPGVGTTESVEKREMEERGQERVFVERPLKNMSTQELLAVAKRLMVDTSGIVEERGILERIRRVCVRALYDFDGTDDEDLSFKTNDIITTDGREYSGDGWVLGFCHGKRGIFPSNYTEKFDAIEAVKELVLATRKGVVCTAAQGGGLEIAGAFVLRGGSLFLDVDVTNREAAPTQQLAVQLNKNAFGILPAQQQQMSFDQPLVPGTSAPYSLPMMISPTMLAPPGTPVTNSIQTALKNIQTGAVLYFNIPVDALGTMLAPVGPMGRDQFLAAWKSVDDSLEVAKEAVGAFYDGNVAPVTKRLHERNIYFVGGRETPGQQIVYYSFKLVQLHMLAEVTFPTGGAAVAPRLCIRSEAPPYAPLALQLLEAALRQ